MEDTTETLARFSYISTFCHSKTSRRSFQNSATLQKCQNDVLIDNINMNASPNIQIYYMHLYCKTKLGYPWKCFSNWVTIVKQIEKTNWDSISFNEEFWDPKPRSRISKPIIIISSCVECLMDVPQDSQCYTSR